MNNREERHAATAVAAPSIREFLLWLLASRNVTVQAVNTDEYVAEFPPSWAELLGRSRWRFALPRDAAVPLDSLLPLLRRLSLSGDPLHARPRNQPDEIHELSANVLGHYEVEAGHATWGKHVLELRPLLRLSFLGGAGGEELLHRFFQPTGEPLADDLVASLRLEELQSLAKSTEPDWSRDRLQDWIQEAQRQLADEPPAGTFLGATIVWCRYLRGEILFRAAGDSAALEIEGWAQLFADGALTPPRFTCAQTGESSYRLARTDDGVVTADRGVATCACSRTRVLASRLWLCGETGVRALPEFFANCAVTNEAVLAQVLQTCLLCRQRVRQVAMQDGICQCCRSLRSVGKDDPRLARLLGQYPRLDRFRRWSIAEGAQCYVLSARTFGKYLLLVVRKEGLEPLRVALRRRWFRGVWHDVAADEYSLWLGEV